jgi:hypothetical protein
MLDNVWVARDTFPKRGHRQQCGMQRIEKYNDVYPYIV